MKKSIFLVAAFCGMALLSSCGGTTQSVVQADQEVFVPCSGPEFMTNNEYIRASAMGLSTDMNMAKKKALASARTDIASAIETRVRSVIDEYGSSYQNGENEEAKSRYQQMSRSSINQSLRGLRTICEKTMKTPDGKYKVYVTLELAGEQLLEDMAQNIKADDKLRVDFEYEKFKKIFEEEMANYK